MTTKARLASYLILPCLEVGVLGMPAVFAQATEAAQQSRTPAAPWTLRFDDPAVAVDSIRLENEIKLAVPDEIVDDVWAYLQQRYRNDLAFLTAAAGRLRAEFSDESFRDRYFDTPDLSLLGGYHGLRHRSRAILGQPGHRKDGRELMQVKLSGVGGDPNTRGEIKYEIRYYAGRRRYGTDDVHPVLKIVKRSDRPALRARLADLEVDAGVLREVLSISQHRRRVYLVDDAGVFASLTLDEAVGRRWWMRSAFTELELELSELRYTAADSATRQSMEAVSAQIREDLVQRFPQIAQDQTPKYNKMHAALSERHPLFEATIRATFQATAVTGVLSVSGLGSLLFGAWLAQRRRLAAGGSRRPGRLETARDWSVRYRT